MAASNRKTSIAGAGGFTGPVALKNAVTAYIGMPVTNNGTDFVGVLSSQSISNSHTVIGLWRGKMSDSTLKTTNFTGDGSTKVMCETGIFRFPVKSGDSPAASTPGTTVYCTLDDWEAAAGHNTNTRPVLGKLVGVDPANSSFVFVNVNPTT